MRYIVVLGMIALIILSGCTFMQDMKDAFMQSRNQSILTQPSPEEETTLTVCDPMCGENQECADGMCVCADGFFGCSGACISEDQCCINEDCAEGEICDASHACIVDCETMFCPLNQVCIAEAGGCNCKTGTTWCEAQQRCIEDARCCDGESCVEYRRRTICSKITVSAEICTEYEGTKSCKFVREQGENTFFLSDLECTIALTQVFEGPFFDVTVQTNAGEENVQKLELSPDGSDRVRLDAGPVLWIKSLSYQGGECMEPD